MPRVVQYDFSGGEVAPEVQGRRDVAKYPTAVDRLRNFTTRQTGPISNREGGEHAGMENFNNVLTRKRNAVNIAIPAFDVIVSSTAANPVELNYGSLEHGYETGDTIYVTGVATADELNARKYVVTRVDDEHVTLDGVDGSGYGVGSGGISQQVDASLPVRCIKFKQHHDFADRSDYSLYFGNYWMMPVRNGFHETDDRRSRINPSSKLTITDATAGKPPTLEMQDERFDLIPGDEILFPEIPASAGDWSKLSQTRHRISFSGVTLLAGKGASTFTFVDDGGETKLAVNIGSNHGFTIGTFHWLLIDWDSIASSYGDFPWERIRNRWFHAEAQAGQVLYIVNEFQSILPEDLPWDPYLATFLSLAGRVHNRVGDLIELDEFDATGFTGTWPSTDVLKIRKVVTPYSADEIFDLEFRQDDNSMTVVSPNHKQRTLTRLDDEDTGVGDDWELAIDNFLPGIAPPATIGADSGTVRRLAVTSIERRTGAQSLPRYKSTLNTETNDIVLTPEPEDDVFEWNVYGSYADEARIGFITLSEVPEFEVDNRDIGTTAFPRIFSIRPPEHPNPFETLGSQASINAISLAQDNPELGQTGTGIGPPCDNRRVEVDGITTGPKGLNRRRFLYSGDSVSSQAIVLLYEDSEGLTAWSAGGTVQELVQTKFPTAVGFFGQRRIFAHEQTIYCCRLGIPGSFEQNIPVRDSDAFEFKIDLAVGIIRYLIGTKHLLAFTKGGIFAIDGGGVSGAVLTPSNVAVRQDYFGPIADVRPITVNRRVLFVADAGPTLRDISFDGGTEQYAGSNLSLLAPHMLEGYNVKDITYTADPDAIVWVVRSDGHMVALTYSSEHQVFGWHDHDTRFGLYESCCTAFEGTEDARYDVVKRTLGGVTRRHFERRIARRLLGDSRRAFCVDAGLRVDNPQVATPLAEDPLRILTPNAVDNWAVNDIIDIEHWIDKDGKARPGNHHKRQYEVKSFITNTEVTLRAVGAGADIDGTDILDDTILVFKVRLATNTIERGLQHLAGLTVDVWANGISYSRTITNATPAVLSLPASTYASQWSIGFAPECDVQSLPPESQEDTLIGRKLATRRVILLLHDAVKGSIGPNVDLLRALPNKTVTEFNSELELLGKAQELDIQVARNDGQFFYRHSDPSPITILAAVTEYD